MNTSFRRNKTVYEEALPTGQESADKSAEEEVGVQGLKKIAWEEKKEKRERRGRRW